MKYYSYIPDDFVNETKVLLCMRKLSCLVSNQILPKGIKIEILETGEPYKIVSSNGKIFLSNVKFKVNGISVDMHCTSDPYSSYPFTCFYNGTETAIFNNHGNISQEFIERFSLTCIKAIKKIESFFPDNFVTAIQMEDGSGYNYNYQLNGGDWQFINLRSSNLIL